MVEAWRSHESSQVAEALVRRDRNRSVVPDCGALWSCLSNFVYRVFDFELFDSERVSFHGPEFAGPCLTTLKAACVVRFVRAAVSLCIYLRWSRHRRSWTLRKMTLCACKPKNVGVGSLHMQGPTFLTLAELAIGCMSALSHQARESVL